MNSLIRLVELKKEDIEDVRVWRNKITIKKNFLNQALITPSQQLEWFGRINPLTEKYFIAYYKDKKIGLFYATNIDNKRRICEPNGFVGIEEYIHTPIAGIALLQFFQLLFVEFEMIKLKGKILKHNHSFIELHKQLNAKITHDQNSDIVHVELSKKDFQKFANKYPII